MAIVASKIAAYAALGLSCVSVATASAPAKHGNILSSGVPDGVYTPPYFPAPYGGWVAEWQDSYKKAKALVDNMTLAEKTNITAGSGVYMGHCAGNSGSALRLGFPQLCLGDAANGVRHADNVTVFPDGITTGATFDKDLMYQRGVAMGKEARGKGVNVLLGPTVGPIGRKPKGGRNWEGFGADPVLQGIGAAQTIKGIQEQGVIATVKHLIGNEQEMYRMFTLVQNGYSSNIDDRSMHELYLWPFADSVRAGVGAAMAAYNAVNGTPCAQHPYLMSGLLKDELGFQGFIMSDWLAQMSGVDSAVSGLDMGMPGDGPVPVVGTTFWMWELTRSVLNGTVPMDRLNDMATRVVAAWYQMGQDKNYPATNFDTNTGDAVGFLYPAAIPFSPEGVVNHFVQVQADHDVIARQVAQDGITLLKNDGNLLPLSNSSVLSVFGTDAQTNPDGPNACSDRNCNKGTLGQGWGSGTVDYMYLDDPITALKLRASNVTFYNTDSFSSSISQPADAEVAMVFITSDAGENTYTVEGNHGDRDASGLSAWHGGDALVKAAAAKYKSVVVVMHTVGPLVVEPWIDLPSVKAVVIAHLPGQEAGKSLTNILYGDTSPSGHLPYSMTKSESDMPASVTTLINSEFLNKPQDNFSEGLYIDYRWLNKNGTKPRYAFGHGLSYTSFSFSEPSIKKVTQLATTPPPRQPKSGILNYSQKIPSYKEGVTPAGFNTIPRYLYSWLSDLEAKAAAGVVNGTYPYPPGYSTQQKPGPVAGGAQGGNPALWDIAYTVSLTVKNTGTKYPGKASVQAYIQFPDGIKYDTPIIQLRDFEKTKELAPGQSASVTLSFTRRDLSVWDIVSQNWIVPKVDGAYKIWIGDSSDNLTLVCDASALSCGQGKGPVNAS